MSFWSSISKRLLNKGQQRCTECRVLLDEERVEWVNGFPACRDHVERVLNDTYV